VKQQGKLIAAVMVLLLAVAACNPESARDTENPRAAITAPAGGAELAVGTVQVTGTASDNTGVTSVELIVDGAVAGTTTVSDETWSLAWNAAEAGEFTLVARAHDAAGNTADSAAIQVTVSAPPGSEASGTEGDDETGDNGDKGDNGEDGKDGDGKDGEGDKDGEDGKDAEAPAVSITWPAKDSVLPANKTLTLRGTAGNGSPVATVKVFADGVLLGAAELNDADWAFDWQAGDPGPVTLHAKAFDEAGNAGESELVSVTLTGGVIEGELVLRPGLTPPASAAAAIQTLDQLSSPASELALPAPNQIMVLLESGRLTLPAGIDSSQTAKLQSEVQSLARSYGLLNAHVYAPTLGFAVMDVPAGMSPELAAAGLSRDSRVRAASPSYWMFPDATPNDQFFPRQWAIDMLDGEVAWNTSTGKGSVVVAVLDTGMAGAPGWTNLVGLHPDVFPNLIDGYDFVSDYDLDQELGGLQPYEEAVEAFPVLRYLDADEHPGWDRFPVEEYTFNTDLTISDFGGHGTHVAGTIGAAGNNGSGIAGVNWNVSIQPIRVLGSVGGLSSDVIAGVMYAAGIPVYAPGTSGPAIENKTPARIINMSLGGGPYDAVSDLVYTHLLQDLGVLVVAAAGNSSEDTDLVPHYPSSYRAVMAVSSVDYILDDGSSPGVTFSDFFSNYGSDIDISAPGGLCWKDAEAFMNWNLATGLCDAAPFVISAGWSWFEAAAEPANLVRDDRPLYYFSAGTSMAAPHVAGAAALALSINPKLSALQLWDLLTGTASRVDDSHLVGYGEPDQEHDPFYGYGLLNLAAVVEAAGSGEIQAVTRTAFVEAQALGSSFVRRIEAEADLTFSFTDLPAGEYEIRAGVDANGNGLIGESGEYYGEFEAPVLIESGETIEGDISVILRRLP
jgi:subtilisin family serine protease